MGRAIAQVSVERPKKPPTFFTFPSLLAPFASFFAPRAEPRAWLRAIAPALASLHPPPAERPVGVPYFSYVGDSILGNKAILGDAAEVGFNAVITSRGGPNDPASSQT